jgi:hypothetical protein
MFRMSKPGTNMITVRRIPNIDTQTKRRTHPSSLHQMEALADSSELINNTCDMTCDMTCDTTWHVTHD